MLSKATIQKIAALTKIDIAAIEAALKSDKEEELSIADNLSVFTADELSARDANMKKDGGTERERIGEEKGKELAVKAIKAKLGITDASKDPDTIAGVIQQQITGDKALKDQVTLLQTEIQNKEAKISEFSNQLKSIKEDMELVSLLPAKRVRTLEDSEHTLLIKQNLQFTNEGVMYKGELLRKPTTKDPMTKAEAIAHFYEQRKTLLADDGDGGAGGGAGAGGRGGSGSSGGTGSAKTLKELRQSWQKDNPGQTWGNEQSQMFVQETLKKNPDLVMDDDGKD